MSYSVYTLAQRPELYEQTSQFSQYWLPFMQEDSTSNMYWHILRRDFPEFQFAMVDENSGEVIARGHSLPIIWDGTLDGLPPGWRDTFPLADAIHKRGDAPNTLSAIEISVKPHLRGKGISAQMVAAMREIAKSHGFANLIAPVRPSQKDRYPLAPIERYMRWTQRDSDALFDAWLRVHWKAGAEILKAAPHSMDIRGTIADWESWTDMVFPESGDYVVPGALVPVRMDCENDEGVYIEPNVWMRHRVK